MRYTSCSLNRRDFVRAVAATALGAGPVLAGGRPLDPLSPGIKISLQIPSDFTGEELVFARQLGVEYVSIPTRGGTYETFAGYKQRVEAAGLKVANIGNANVHNMPEVTLNLPGRDQKIEEYQQYLRDLARAGIFYTTYAHMGNGIWSSQRETTRGGAAARAFRLETAKGSWNGKTFESPLTHGRKFTKEELWDNYTFFIKRVAPVAEELGIRIGIHPDDPPVPELGGVPRCIFGNFDGYARPGNRPQSEHRCLSLLWHLDGRRPRYGQGRLGGDAGLRQPGQALENPFPQRQRAHSGLRRDLCG